MQVISLELEETNEMTVYKRHGLHTKAQIPKIKVSHRNEPASTLVLASITTFFLFMSRHLYLELAILILQNIT